MALNRVRTRVGEEDGARRATNFKEVCYGYTLDEVQSEAARCIECKRPRCVEACPVGVQIPQFIAQLKRGNIDGAAKIIAQDNLLPSVCGRVCPQEVQCEGSCVMGVKGDAVAIGLLERFVGDWKIENNSELDVRKVTTLGKRVAVVGSGPAGLACAADLAKYGYDVTIFEVLHKAGGVLQYGIPEFRLPKEKIVEKEIEAIKSLGVKIITDIVVGRTVTIEELMGEEWGFEAVFIGSGAGLPKFMGIEGESLNGVLSANEFLTRANLMRAYDDSYDTPIITGDHVVVVGGGNVAMDAVRTAKRLGAKASIVYRRSQSELPARLEEVHHAKEEGIEFYMLTNPTKILSTNDGWVRGIECVRMELGEADSSGRRSPKVVKGSEFEMECSTVIMALGTSPNPLIAQSTTGLETKSWGGIVADHSGVTSLEGVFAGGDAVTGAATVILAMGAGRKAAQAIDQWIKSK